MLAVRIRQFGPPETHAIEELPDLVPAAGEVVVDVRAIAANYPDLLVVQGLYQAKVPLPFAPGKDGAGVVRSVGAGVMRVKPADRVVIHVENGTYATQVIAREAECLPLPDEMDFVQAAVLGMPAQTAWFALHERGGFTAGKTVLVNGATGAVGLAAAQIAAALGGKVLAGVSTRARAEELLRGTRCDIVDLTAHPLRDRLREQVLAATGGHGADVVIDPLGGDVFDASLRALAWDGRIVTLGFAAGRIPEVKANYLLVKNITATGLQWSDYRGRRPELVAKAHDALVALWRRGALRTQVARTLPLARFAQALRTIEAREVTGRIVLTTG